MESEEHGDQRGKYDNEDKEIWKVMGVLVGGGKDQIDKKVPSCDELLRGSEKLSTVPYPVEIAKEPAEGCLGDYLNDCKTKRGWKYTKGKVAGRFVNAAFEQNQAEALADY